PDPRRSAKRRLRLAKSSASASNRPRGLLFLALLRRHPMLPPSYLFAFVHKPTHSTEYTSGQRRSRMSIATRSDPGLQSVDPEVFALIERDKLRHSSTLNFIASENYASRAVLETLASHL